MKRVLKKMATVILSVIMAVTMISSFSQSDVYASTVTPGSGSEADPTVATITDGKGELTINYDGMTGSLNSRPCHIIKLVFQTDARVSVKESTDPKYIDLKMYKRYNGSGAEISQAPSNMSLASMCVKKGDVIWLVRYRTNSSIKSGTLTVTTQPLTGENEYCPKAKDGRHFFYSGGKCSWCGFVCAHPQSARIYDTGYSHIAEQGQSKHAKCYKCSVCGVEKLYDKAEPCRINKWTYNDAYTHEGTCSVCKARVVEHCTNKYIYTKISKGRDVRADLSWEYHNATAKCKTCGHLDSGASNVRGMHTFRKNVCTKCGFKRVVPSTPKIKTLKKTGAAKKKKYSHKAYWDRDSRGTLRYHKAAKWTEYKYSISYKVSAKNAVRYVVTTSKDWRDSAQYLVANTKKSKGKVSVQVKSNVKKITLYITPISKTGTPGKTVKKMVRLR